LPESFYVLVKEIESLGLSIELRETEGSSHLIPKPVEDSEPAAKEDAPAALDALIPDMEGLEN
jgi:hypothetical protein